MSFQPTEEARKVDELLDKLLREHPPNPENLAAWTMYHRTVLSRLNQLDRTLEVIVEEKKEREASAA